MKQVFVFAMGLSLLVGCNSPKQEVAIDTTVEMDSVFCERLLPPLGGGVTGADGAISIDLKDGRSMFMWGDSFFGDVVDDVRQQPVAFMMGNVFTTIDDKEIKNYFQGTPQEPRSYIEADSTGKGPTWYWPGHGFVKDGILYLFMSKFYKQGNGPFGFEYERCDYFTLDAKTLKVLTKTNFPAANENGVHYGHAVLEDGKYVYVYGTLSDNKAFAADVHVARCVVDNKALANFEFWDGTNWQTDAKKSQKIGGVTQAVSEQFNVVKLHDKYILVTQDRFKNVKDIYSFTSDKPQGPFGNEKLIYTVNEPNYEADSMMTYNTMVHPQYIKNDKVLMCYNVNTYDMEKVWVKASVYKPRFFWMPITNMTKE
ncbi:uncharacterized protein DUF4185 [Dysgonomonas alginatilytica]|uniref:Uncharacterized protein DUF4185 n=1 Tax=Dysgonomonas alginatilytica TaxID=1605892 RepID=A0A2V3PLA8_9BACT|nr:DUF4185 domain-containing protein [Dysgonomonas alginatilytica]PXV59982.1 uncharacterized protein DUF4185 [Dysgonomonas alginatilytica]